MCMLSLHWIAITQQSLRTRNHRKRVVVSFVLVVLSALAVSGQNPCCHQILVSGSADARREQGGKMELYTFERMMGARPRYRPPGQNDYIFFYQNPNRWYIGNDPTTASGGFVASADTNVLCPDAVGGWLIYIGWQGNNPRFVSASGTYQVSVTCYTSTSSPTTNATTVVQTSPPTKSPTKPPSNSPTTPPTAALANTPTLPPSVLAGVISANTLPSSVTESSATEIRTEISHGIGSSASRFTATTNSSGVAFTATTRSSKAGSSTSFDPSSTVDPRARITDDDDESGESIGIAFGVILSLVFVAVVIVFVLRHRQTGEQSDYQEPEITEPSNRKIYDMLSYPDSRRIEKSRSIAMNPTYQTDKSAVKEDSLNGFDEPDTDDDSLKPALRRSLKPSNNDYEGMANRPPAQYSALDSSHSRYVTAEVIGGFGDQGHYSQDRITYSFPRRDEEIDQTRAYSSLSQSHAVYAPKYSSLRGPHTTYGSKHPTASNPQYEEIRTGSGAVQYAACRYKSTDGLKCKRTAMTGSLHCEAHTCTKDGCTGIKRSSDRYCSKCAAEDGAMRMRAESVLGSDA